MSSARRCALSGSADAKLVQDYRRPSHAALHADYRYFRDDWSIRAHTLELAWHQALTPLDGDHRSCVTTAQSAADFYRPYVNCGVVPGYECALALKHYASDYRLAAFGALSTGLGVTGAARRGRASSL